MVSKIQNIFVPNDVLHKFSLVEADPFLKGGLVFISYFSLKKGFSPYWVLREPIVGIQSSLGGQGIVICRQRNNTRHNEQHVQ